MLSAILLALALAVGYSAVQAGPSASANSVTGGGPVGSATGDSVTGGGPDAPAGTNSVTGGGPD
jgi:hypothetical protein